MDLSREILCVRRILMLSLDAVAPTVTPPPRARPRLRVSLHPDVLSVGIAQSGVQSQPSVVRKVTESQDKERPRLEGGHRAGRAGSASAILRTTQSLNFLHKNKKQKEPNTTCPPQPSRWS